MSNAADRPAKGYTVGKYLVGWAIWHSGEKYNKSYHGWPVLNPPLQEGFSTSADAAARTHQLVNERAARRRAHEQIYGGKEPPLSALQRRLYKQQMASKGRTWRRLVEMLRDQHGIHYALLTTNRAWARSRDAACARWEGSGWHRGDGSLWQRRLFVGWPTMSDSVRHGLDVETSDACWEFCGKTPASAGVWAEV